MDAAAAHGVNKSACRMDTILHMRALRGREFSTERVQVLLGPKACDVFDLRAAGNVAVIHGFERNDENMSSAIQQLATAGIHDVIFTSHLENNRCPFNSVIYDFCKSWGSVRTTVARMLNSEHWMPEIGSSLTFGVSYGRTEKGQDNDRVWDAAAEMASMWGRKPEYAEGLAFCIARDVEVLMYSTFRTLQIRLQLVGVRWYRSENGGTNMLYATFVVTPRTQGRRRRPVRKHYYCKTTRPSKVAEAGPACGQDCTNNDQIRNENITMPTQTTKTVTATATTKLTAGQKAAQTRRANQLAAKRTATALKAWETRRANAR